ncbi:MAG: hypothetical protein ABT11_06295 [Novosphingobium sp. SCN 66-18]|nr:MAG: hypothetical protein ABT11_06295 [Novosphingobium sp. SCN 66-18]
MGKVRLWDAPVRLFHWSVVALFGALWWSGENGRIDLHKTIGLVMLGLVVFRVLWGFLGGSTARFGSFVKGPGTVLAYLRASREGKAPTIVGHNPLGGWSVLVLLGLLALQVGLGLIAQDTDAVASGPLNHFVSYDTGDAAGEAHEVVFNILLLFVALHVAAVLFYLFVKRDNLIHPMLSGHKAFTQAVEQPTFAPAWRLILSVILAAAFAGWIALGAPFSLEQAKQAWQAPPPSAEESYM